MKKKPPPNAGKRGNTKLARREKKAADMLPYARHIDETTLATRDGAQIQILHLTGFAFETADTQELNYPAIMRAIKATGFTGFVAQEFIPKRTPPLDSLRAAVKLCTV